MHKSPTMEEYQIAPKSSQWSLAAGVREAAGTNAKNMLAMPTDEATNPTEPDSILCRIECRFIVSASIFTACTALAIRQVTAADR
jgi:hypothetical protein